MQWIEDHLQGEAVYTHNSRACTLIACANKKHRCLSRIRAELERMANIPYP
jgi:hypothetical protein